MLCGNLPYLVVSRVSCWNLPLPLWFAWPVVSDELLLPEDDSVSKKKKNHACDDFLFLNSKNQHLICMYR